MLPLTRLYAQMRRYYQRELIEKICECGCNKKFKTRNYQSKFIQGHCQKLKIGNKYNKKWKFQSKEK